MQPLKICIGPIIRIGRESWCLPYAGFLHPTSFIRFQNAKLNLKCIWAYVKRFHTMQRLLGNMTFEPMMQFTNLSGFKMSLICVKFYIYAWLRNFVLFGGAVITVEEEGN